MPKTARSPALAPDAEIDLGVLRGVLGFRIRRIQNHISRSFLDLIHRTEVKSGMFSALALIASNPGISQITLAREIGFDKATVVTLLDAMEALGWAERRRDAKDRRRHALMITAGGEGALKELQALALANEAKIRKSLTKTEMAQLVTLLDKVYDICFDDSFVEKG